MAMASWIAKRSKHSGVREQFEPYIEIPPGQPGASTNMSGKCKSCRQDISLTLARTAAHFLKKKGHDVAVCTARDPPEAAVLAAKAYFDTVKLTKEGVLTKRARDTAFSQQTIPSSFKGGVRKETHHAFAALVFGTGLAFDARKHYLFKKLVPAVSKDPGWHAEHRMTIADVRLDEAYAKIGDIKAVMEGEDMRHLGQTWSTDEWKNPQVRLNLYIYIYF